MDSKRDLDGEKRLIRNEKARRKRALAYACRYLPIELEKEVFSYMKNPDNGRVEVGMKWQKHPTAKVLQGAPAFDRVTGTYNSSLGCYITLLIQRMRQWPGFFRKCREVFTRRMQLTIARKAFTQALSDINPKDRSYGTINTFSWMTADEASELLISIEWLIQLGDWREELHEDDWPWDFNRMLLVEMRDGFDECARESFRQSPSWRQENLAQPLKVLQAQLQYFESQIEYSKET